MNLRILGACTVLLMLGACGGQKAANSAAVTTNAPLASAPPATLSPGNAAAPTAQGDWQSTASGLRYRKVSGAGTGRKPTLADIVTIHYVGTLTDGTEFDSSRGEPVTFPLADLIPGWQEGVPLMSVGDVYEFMVPPELGYGSRQSGPIPPNSTLYFRVGLVAIGG